MTLRHIFISPEHNFFGRHGLPAGDSPVIELDEVEAVAGKGLRGDRFFDWKRNGKGQVTFFSMEVYEVLCRRFGVNDRPPSVFRRNLLVSGADLNALIGQEFELQGVRFFGTEESRPCYWMNSAFCDGAEAAMEGNGGLRARILTDGVLRVKPRD